MSPTRLADLAQNFIRPQITTVPGAAIPYPYGGTPRQVQIDLNQQALHSYRHSRRRNIVNAMTSQNLITPTGPEKIGKLEYTVSLNDAPLRIGWIRQPADQVGGWHCHLYA